MNVYINGSIICPEGILENHVVIASDKIQAIIPKDTYIKEDHHQVIDLKGNYLSPGFIDVHIHGAGGYDTMDGSLESFNEISRLLPSSGVTAFLSATMTMSKDRIHQSLSCAKDIIEGGHHVGAELLGIHAEGPFISEKYKGAQNPDFIEAPHYDFYKPYYDIIKLITIAPETDHGHEFAKNIHSHHSNIVLSIGHSEATFDEAVRAFESGYKHVTHLFNAMTGLHHREPGIVGAALIEDFYTEVIADNVHMRPELYPLIVKAKGKDRIILITDAMCAACLSPGEYSLGGQKVIVDEKSARLTSGALAGSILRMNQGIKNFYTHGRLALHEAVNLASKNPAEELGLYHKIGSITPGKDADLIIMSEDLAILQTYCKGQLVYSAD